MDKASIIRFSDTVREKLLQETQRKAAYYGILPDTIQEVDDEFEDSIIIGDKVFNIKIKQQREQLVKEVREKGYTLVIDEITYTWFNRFVALKFMEVNGYLPVKVFSSDEPKKQEPDILTKSLKLDFLKTDRDTVIDLKSGGKDEELYKYLTLKLCNYLNHIMPFLFEHIEDYTELLFPGKLLHTDSILKDLNDIIKEEDWKEVEVIGWIYQDYIAPRKDKVFNDLKKNIKISKENIPAATQLFTPHWIVRYLVENSLGRLWMLNRPNSRLIEHMEYYIKPEQLETDFLKINSPEEIKVCDPACGSGHMLVYAFDLLYCIYEEEGYSHSEIPEKILTYNLFGIEIDERAGELAAFALTMKARRKDRNFFSNPVQPKICVLQSVSFEEDELKSYMAAIGSNLFNTGLKSTLLQFVEADNFGSLIRPTTTDVSDIRHMLTEKNLSGNLTLFTTHQKVIKVLEQVDYLSPKYHVVIANPPYMGGKGMNTRLKTFAQEIYPNSKYDFFAMFIERNLDMTVQKGMVAMITMQSWMFLLSFEKLRENILNNDTILSMAHLGPRAFDSIGGEVVSTTAFVIENELHENLKGAYLRLINGKNEAEKEAELKAQKSEPFYASSADFNKIPGSPIAYWVSKNLINAFDNFQNIGQISVVRKGLVTLDDARFIKSWYEPNYNNIHFRTQNRFESQQSQKKWFPINKGGGYRKWYGFNENVINWKDDGEELKDYIVEKYKGGSYTKEIRSENYYFRENITWGSVTSGPASFRYTPIGFLFSSSGPSVFLESDIFVLCGLLNSVISRKILEIFSPTLSVLSGDVAKIPYYMNMEYQNDINQVVNQCIDISKEEWDSRETSWDFTTNELLHHKTTNRIEDAYKTYCTYWKDQFFKLNINEEELNRIFIDIYDLADELTPDVSLKDITILKDEADIKDGKLVFKKETLVKQFISYAVGCMFGRYSPDKEGLILANQGEIIDDFREKAPDASFMPDEDNIIPILEDEYFTDDIVSRFREFLKVTFGAESLAENLDFIAGALSKSKKGESPEKVIRDYFIKSFFKDHVKMYKKRPIYWLFTSGKGRAFNALVYMHRYNRETLAKMRTDYLLKLEDKLDARMGMLSSESNKDAQEMSRLSKLIDELTDYDAVLNNKALEYIDIDLDDGVKVNYAKFEGLVEKI
ncbi:MAG TPA: BREX-1 system adenine-specific DNA-methyltransferase PglX [archaeon]|nr:BREX-1 system adenine-specific DNA-methyltransferase PglX [archaeon]